MSDLDRAREALCRAAIMLDAATQNLDECTDAYSRAELWNIKLEWRDGLVNAALFFARAARAAEGGEGEK